LSVRQHLVNLRVSLPITLTSGVSISYVYMVKISQPKSTQPELPGLRKLRESYGLGLRELSRRAGIDKGQLSKVERGLETPSWGLMTRLARGLDMPLHSLLLHAAQEPGDD
jgi:DNA-binding XRE family transcriptional regulator